MLRRIVIIGLFCVSEHPRPYVYPLTSDRLDQDNYRHHSESALRNSVQRTRIGGCVASIRLNLLTVWFKVV
ncbi:hypothetical protein NDU88_004217 [Pleurodeles waltl]|uniref:Secreted protein n=1 Tax=Pleurodeles waltl TaxID=8319 RepID=A0AAV7T7I7_PLEWA|nr:hypothetical protein NDU88_004217 [Pleurodeles waltl]